MVEMMQNAGAFVLQVVSTVYAWLVQIVMTLWERPLLTVAVFAVMVVIVWRVEVAQKKVDAILAEAEKEEQ